MRTIPRRGSLRWVLGFLAALSISVACIAFYRISIFDPCVEVIRNTIPAPDQKAAVVVFERGCGATSPFNTQISLATMDQPFSSKKDPPFFIISGQRNLLVKWTGEKTVTVGAPAGSTIFKKENKVDEISVEYTSPVN